MKTLYIALVLLLSINPIIGQAQSKNELPEQGISNSGLQDIIEKGSFFITPYYQFSHFKNLKLISHTNTYELYEGNSFYKFPDDEIAEYNDNFKTEYTNNLAGIRLGYQVLNGVSVSAFVGMNSFVAKSWISEEGAQKASTQYPSFTFGGAVNYYKKLKDNLFLIGFGSITYINTSNLKEENDAAEEIIASKIDALYWDADLALTIKLGKFFPYAGVGFTQLFLEKVTTEQIPVLDDNENPFYNKTIFDSNVRGNGIYGFAGFEYKLLKKLSIYARGTFPHPVRITTGVKINFEL